MASMGFGRKEVDRITAQYGHKFADWPKELSSGYWKAQNAAHATQVKLVAR